MKRSDTGKTDFFDIELVFAPDFVDRKITPDLHQRTVVDTEFAALGGAAEVAGADLGFIIFYLQIRVPGTVQDHGTGFAAHPERHECPLDGFPQRTVDGTYAPDWFILLHDISLNIASGKDSTFTGKLQALCRR